MEEAFWAKGTSNAKTLRHPHLIFSKDSEKAVPWKRMKKTETACRKCSREYISLALVGHSKGLDIIPRLQWEASHWMVLIRKVTWSDLAFKRISWVAVLRTE